MRRHTDFRELKDLEYLPANTPIYDFPCFQNESPLRQFIALQKDALLILGPRRLPPTLTPASNTYTSLSIFTSVGFRTLEVSDYVEATQKLRPDIVVSCVDVVHGGSARKLGLKRKEKMTERTLAWTKALISGLDEERPRGTGETSLWVPILPIEREMQIEYLDYLEEEDVKVGINGIVLYDIASIDAIPPSLAAIPRLALTAPANPQSILHEVGLGIDILTIPFVSTATDAGIALSFTFSAPLAQPPHVLALGIDMWSSKHATDLSPLQPGCTCYACSSHHRAYIHHLLSAKEMLGWVLLQIHNHTAIDVFFEGVRASIARGTFVEDCEAFEKIYEPELPVGSGSGPRYVFQYLNPVFTMS